MLPNVTAVDTLSSLGVILIILTVLWLTSLTFLFSRLNRHYNRLAGVKKGDLQQTLEEILQSQKNQQKHLDNLEKKVDKIESSAKTHLQKLGLVRFNPFADTGGQQSFVLSLLNDLGNGLVLTSLHSRDKTRWYAKKVREGQGFNQKLTQEEKQAIKQAHQPTKLIS